LDCDTSETSPPLVVDVVVVVAAASDNGCCDEDVDAILMPPLLEGSAMLDKDFLDRESVLM